jgi:hypothetical protein
VSAPDVAGVLAGFRSWRIAQGRLMSPFIPCRWEGRVLHATCFDANRSLLRGEGWLGEPHASPHPDCQCGIYAWYEPSLRTYYGEVSFAEGVIAGWGRVEVHADGWRAEHGRVEALALPGRGERLDATVRAIAGRLGVPVVARAELPDVAAATGGLVPAALRPDGVRGWPSARAGREPG